MEYVKNKYDRLVFYLFFFYGTGVTAFNTSDASLIVMACFGFLYMYFVKKELIDAIFLYILLYWVIINFFSWAFIGGESFHFLTLGGSILKLFIGYSFMKIFKEQFIVRYEETLYALALISVPFFAIQLEDSNIFSKIPFNFIDQARGEEGHWYGILFHYSSWHPSQNSGFAGEPGGFGYYIGLAMILNLVLHRGRLNKRFLILTLIGLTTVSTNFYLTLLVFAGYFVYRSSLLIKLISIALFIPLALVVIQLPFIGEKVGRYFSETKSFSEAPVIRRTRINRMSMFLNDMRDVERYPLGRGVNETRMTTNIYGEILQGTSDLSRIAVRYGLLGFIYFVFVYFRMFYRISFGLKGSFLFAIIMFMYIAANSLERDYFAICLFWLYFLISDAGIRKILGPADEGPLSPEAIPALA